MSNRAQGQMNKTTMSRTVVLDCNRSFVNTTNEFHPYFQVNLHSPHLFFAFHICAQSIYYSNSFDESWNFRCYAGLFIKQPVFRPTNTSSVFKKSHRRDDAQINAELKDFAAFHELLHATGFLFSWCKFRIGLNWLFPILWCTLYLVLIYFLLNISYCPFYY